MDLNVSQWVAQGNGRLQAVLAELLETVISMAVTAIGLIAFGALIVTIGPAVLVALAGGPLWAVLMVLLAL